MKKAIVHSFFQQKYNKPFHASFLGI